MGSDTKLGGDGDNEDCRRRRPGGGALSRTPPWIAPARRGAGASAGVGTGPAREQFKTMIKRG